MDTVLLCGSSDSHHVSWLTFTSNPFKNKLSTVRNDMAPQYTLKRQHVVHPEVPCFWTDAWVCDRLAYIRVVDEWGDDACELTPCFFNLMTAMSWRLCALKGPQTAHRRGISTISHYNEDGSERVSTARASCLSICELCGKCRWIMLWLLD